MKKILLAGLLAILAGQAFANSTYLGQPGASGRERKETLSGGRIEENIERGASDCGLFVELVPVSGTSSVVNLTSTAALVNSTATTGYSGRFKVTVANTQSADVVAFVSLTGTAIGDTVTAKGIVVRQYQHKEFDVAARAGMTLHVRGLTATAIVEYSICNY